MKKFEIPKSNWKSISIESAKFILNESKDYIDYTIKESEKITNRSYTFVILLITLLSAIVGYTFSEVVENKVSILLYLNFYISIVISIIILCLSTLIFPRKLMVKGRKPNELAKKEFLNTPELSNDENYLTFIIQEIQNSQIKINYNLSKNKKRRYWLKSIMIITAFLFPIYLVIAFLIASSS